MMMSYDSATFGTTILAAVWLPLQATHSPVWASSRHDHSALCILITPIV